MATVTYIEHDGTSHQAEVPIGESIMRGAVDNDIPGIDGDCGGQCACATCHVYVDPAWLGKTGERSEMEDLKTAFISTGSVISEVPLRTKFLKSSMIC